MKLGRMQREQLPLSYSKLFSIGSATYLLTQPTCNVRNTKGKGGAIVRDSFVDTRNAETKHNM